MNDEIVFERKNKLVKDEFTTTYKDGVFYISDGKEIGYKKEDIERIFMVYDEDGKLSSIWLYFKDIQTVHCPSLYFDDTFSNYEKLWNILDLSDNNSLVLKMYQKGKETYTDIDLRKNKKDSYSTLHFYGLFGEKYASISYILYIDNDRFVIAYNDNMSIKVNNGSHIIKLASFSNLIDKHRETTITLDVTKDSFYFLKSGPIDNHTCRIKEVNASSIEEFSKYKKRENIKSWIFIVLLLIFAFILSVFI